MTPNETPEKTIRLLRPSVVVLCGPAACGKSTFAARHFRPTQIISSDHCRALVCDDEQDQRFQPQAFALLHFIIEQRLNINRLCVVDSTALTPPARKGLLDLARRYRVPCVALLFQTPLEVCLKRDSARERSVGQAVIEHQYDIFERAKSAIGQEGFDQVIELRDEELDRVRTEIVFRPVPRVAAVPTRPEANRFGNRVPGSRGGGAGRDARNSHYRGAPPAGPAQHREAGPRNPGTSAGPRSAKPQAPSSTERSASTERPAQPPGAEPAKPQLDTSDPSGGSPTPSPDDPKDES